MDVYEEEAMRQQGVLIASQIVSQMSLREASKSICEEAIEQEDYFELLALVIQDEFEYDKKTLGHRIIQMLAMK